MTALTARAGTRGAHACGLVAAGVACVGCTYGMGRYGFGLLLPDMRAELRLSDGTVGALAAGVAAAALFGAAYNVLVAVLGLWSRRTHPGAPARGLAAVMTAMGVGFLAGPPLAALLGQRDAFAAAAVLAVAAAVVTAAPTGRRRYPALATAGDRWAAAAAIPQSSWR